MTVLCLVGLDGAAAADVSLRALTFARGLAGAQEGQEAAWMWQKAGYDQPNATSMAAPDTGAASEAAAGGGGVAVVFGPADGVPGAELSAYGVADAEAVEAPPPSRDVAQGLARGPGGDPRGTVPPGR